jgi:hypothetical protein
VKDLLLARRVTLTRQEYAARRQRNKERATFRKNRQVELDGRLASLLPSVANHVISQRPKVEIAEKKEHIIIIAIYFLATKL